MEKSQKNAEIEKIWAIYNALRAKNIVKTQKNFAEFLGINQNTLAGVFNGREGCSSSKTLRKAESKLAELGITIETGGEHSPAIVQNGNGEQKILGTDAEEIVKTLTAEMAEQRKMYAAHVDRLLGIIEKMQQ